MGNLSKIEIDALYEALDDEFKAWATYDQVIDDFGPVRPFINIRDAEARHIDALLDIYEEYELEPPDNKWIASGGTGGSIILWPMPDLDSTPLHLLPRRELIAKLKALTNLRVARDESSAKRWKLVVGPFPGWEDVPTW